MAIRLLYTFIRELHTSNTCT